MMDFGDLSQIFLETSMRYDLCKRLTGLAILVSLGCRFPLNTINASSVLLPGLHPSLVQIYYLISDFPVTLI